MKPAAPTPRPLDALNSQVATIRALERPEVGPDLIEAMYQSGGHRVSDGVGPIYPPGYGLIGAHEVARKLNEAATIVVTDRILDLVLDKMSAVRFGEVLRPEDLLFPAGYVIFPRSIQVPSLEPDDYVDIYPPRSLATFDSGFWVPMGIVTTGALHGFGGDHQSGVMYAQSESITKLAHYDPAGIDPVVYAAGVDRLRSWGIKHAPIYSSGWSFDVPWDPAEREETFVLTPAGEFERRFWLSFWRTMKEEIFAPVRLRRQDRRPAERMGMVPEVVVADLRRVRYREAEEHLPTGEIIMWTHRWRVTGHLRTLHRGTPLERQTWVREHVKGPENRPLIEKDRVYRVIR